LAKARMATLSTPTKRSALIMIENEVELGGPPNLSSPSRASAKMNWDERSKAAEDRRTDRLSAVKQKAATLSARKTPIKSPAFTAEDVENKLESAAGRRLEHLEGVKLKAKVKSINAPLTPHTRAMTDEKLSFSSAPFSPF
jgi:hypothetical protein